MYYWTHIGVAAWGGNKTCRLCSMDIGVRWQAERATPPYILPLHKNCRCVWWRTEHWPTMDEVSFVVSEWTNNFEWIRIFIGGDIDSAKELLVAALKNDFGWDLIYTLAPSGAPV